MDEEKAHYPLLHVEDVLPILSKIAIFGALNEKQLFKLFRLLETASYGAGEFIYHKGELPRYIYIIRSGEVKIIIDDPRVSLELISFGAGDCFGETALIGLQPHFSSALAVVSTELIMLKKKALLSLYEEDKELFGMLILNIARETARRLHAADEVLMNYILKH